VQSRGRRGREGRREEKRREEKRGSLTTATIMTREAGSHCWSHLLGTKGAYPWEGREYAGRVQAQEAIVWVRFEDMDENRDK
jgi:hypothetical protein